MRQLALALGAILALASPARAELRLLMFEQPGCTYCQAWHAEVGPEYPKTAEGLQAPLWQLQLRDALPPNVALASQPVFTPTFVLVRDGAEIGRIEGYPGEDFFWGLLAGILAEGEAAVRVD